MKEFIINHQFATGVAVGILATLFVLFMIVWAILLLDDMDHLRRRK